MSKIGLKIRRMETGEVVVADFDDVEAAERWLEQRPAFTEVLRVATAIDPAIDARLRAAMRPLDDAERARARALDEAAEQRRAEELARTEQQPEEGASDPDRLMSLRFDRVRGVFSGDASDDREITELARRAVLEWVAERDSWVASRGQWVAAASMSVWPGPIPGGASEDRVDGGQFVTATRPPAGSA